MSEVRCWWINHYSVPSSEPGGTRHFSMARHLHSFGIDTLLIRANTNYFKQDSTATQSKAIELQHHDGVEFAKLRSPKYRGNSVSKLFNMLAFKRELRRSYTRLPGPPPDVIIGSSPHPFAADEARRIAGRLGVPFVYEVRDLWPRSLVDVGGMSNHHPLVVWFRMLERRLCRDAERVITLLPDSHSHFEDLGVDRDRIIHVPNGVDMNMVPATDMSSQEGPFRIMFLGLHGLVYGLGTILDAAQILKQIPDAPAIEFVLVGDGPEKQGLQERVRNEGIEHVVFRDSVPKSRVYETMKDADAFIMLTRRCDVHKSGVSPNKLYDYMSMARPIFYAIEGSSNIIDLAGAGITIPPEDGRALADAAVRLAGLGVDERREMGERGRSYVVEHHDLSKLAGRVAEALREVTGHSGAAASIAG